MSAFIQPEIARNVLFYFGDRTLGWEAGSFTSALIRAVCAADGMNRARLAMVYPDLVTAVVLAQDYDDGLDKLREITTGAPAYFDGATPDWTGTSTASTSQRTELDT